MEAEERYQAEPATGEDADSLFARRWARAVLTAALDRMRAEVERDGEGERFAALQEILQDDAGQSSTRRIRVCTVGPWRAAV